MTSMRTWAAAATVGVALTAAACSSSNPSSSSAAGSTPSSTPTTVGAPPGTIAQPSPAGTAGTKPTVHVPSGPPPAGLEVADLIPGTGPAAKAGDAVTVQYVGVLYANGQQFDASWDRGQPFQFTLGQGQVIPGWDQGVAGMKVGGRRELIIPPALAYGASGQGSIGPNQTLIFIVDLVKIG